MKQVEGQVRGEPADLPCFASSDTSRGKPHHLQKGVDPQPGFKALCQLPPSLVPSDLPEVPHMNPLSAPGPCTTASLKPSLLPHFPRCLTPPCSPVPTGSLPCVRKPPPHTTELSEGPGGLFLGFPPQSQHQAAATPQE